VAESGAPVVPENAGYLGFVVEPWAEVWIGNQRVAVTPTAQSIALPPGRYYVRFYNPYFRSDNREVRVHSGETEILRVSLADLEPGEAPSPPPTPLPGSAPELEEGPSIEALEGAAPEPSTP